MPSSKLPVYNEEHMRAFLGAVMDPAAGCMEMRVFGADFDRGKFIIPAERYTKTFVGWYDDPNKLMVDGKRLNGISGYIIPNPVNRIGLDRADNKLIIAKGKDTASNDTDIVCLRWLFLDVDSIRPKKDISATEEELAKALAKRDEILTVHPELARSALWGRSGNGGWIFVRLPDYPNDSDHRALIARALTYFSSRFDDNGAEIDPKCKNPSRLTALPGTMKCKGSNRPERPWRLATFDSWAEGVAVNPEALDLGAWLTLHAPLKRERTTQGDGGKGKGRRKAAQDDSADQRIRRATAYIDALAPAISGQGGHDQTFDAACALIKGFNLSVPEARPILERFNQRCEPPWQPHELEHKLSDADEKPDDKPRGYLSVGYFVNAGVNGVHTVNGDATYIDPRPILPNDGRATKGGLTQKPVIECRDVSLAFATFETLLALGDANDPPQMFDFGGLLAWIKTTIGESAQSYIEAMHYDAIRNRIADIGTFIETVETKAGSRQLEIFPPVAIVRAIAAQKKWDIRVAPPLELLVESPRFLPDGRLITEPGYHREALIYYQPPAGGLAADVPEKPSTAQVEAAKDLIFKEYLVDFPFADDASKANALACMLLPFVRLMIDGPTPLHLFEASTEGTGKGKLARACAFPALGRELSAMSQREDEAEWRKSFTTMFQSGGSHLYIDNLYNPKSWDGTPMPIDSANLAFALTEPIWVDRILGTSHKVRIKIRCIWMASGNNVEWSKELGRRIVPVRLTTPTENPSERRNFHCSPYTLEEWERQHRLSLLNACLTLCQHWIRKGRPVGSVCMGSYESYSRIMGGILEAAGVPGFLANRSKAAQKDRESVRWPALIRAWHQNFGGQIVSASDLHGLIFGAYYSEDRSYPGIADLQVAFADIVGDKSPLSQKQKLGRAMAKQEDRIWAGFRIIRSESVSATGNIAYHLKSVKNNDNQSDQDDSDNNTEVIQSHEVRDDGVPF
jgi:hypothetical protein